MESDQKQILENNILIAEFMGYTINEDGNLCKGVPLLASSDLKYHESYDWLMPVIEKIAAIGQYSVKMTCHGGSWNCEIWDNRPNLQITLQMGKPLQEGIYKNVVEFIKWYNKNLNLKPNNEASS